MIEPSGIPQGPTLQPPAPPGASAAVRRQEDYSDPTPRNADAAQQLWRLWEQGQRPDLTVFLAQRAPVSAEDLTGLLRVDQRERWQRGERVQAEMYLQRWPQVQANAELALDLVYGEFLLRDDLGETPDLAEYQGRFPDLAEPLSLQVALHRALESEGTAASRLPHRTRAGSLPGGPTVPRKGVPGVAGYEIVGELGRGGIGVVYLARHVALNRLVALKMLKAGPLVGSGELARFRQEAEAVARLQHPNIVQVFEVGEHEGRPYLSLEYAEGGSLSSRLDGTPLPPRHAAELVETLARAMDAAHRAGIIHRDLKPANVLLQNADRRLQIENHESKSTPAIQSAICNLKSAIPKITDFGLAKRLDDPAGQTRSGDIMGTPSYMAPEQAEGKPDAIGPPTDIYALGAILYELLTGRPPFRGETAWDTIAAVIGAEPVPPSRLQPKAPRDLETICLKCLEKQPEKRYSDALALAEDLRRFLGGEPIRARPVGRGERALKWAKRRPAVAALLGVSGVAVLALVVVVVGLFFYTRLELAHQDAKTQRGIAEEQRGRAEKQQGIAEEQRDRAEQLKAEADRLRRQAERLQYVADMSLAQRAWQSNQPALLGQLLDRYGPGSGMEALLGFEWHYLRRLTRSELHTLPHPSVVSSVAVSPDGKLLASSGNDSTIRLWDPATGQEIRAFKETMWARRIAFSPDGKCLAGASGAMKAQVWNVTTGQEIHSLGGQERGVWSVAFSGDGKRIATGCEDASVKVWDADTGKELLALRGGHISQVNSVAFSPDGKFLASGSPDKTVRVWDAAGKAVRILRQAGPVTSLAFSPDGKSIVTGSGDGTVRLWDVASAKEVQTFAGHVGEVWSVAFAPDGRSLVSAGDDQSVRVWEVSKREVWDFSKKEPLSSLLGHSGNVRSVAFSPDGRRIYTASEDRTVKVWDPLLGQERRSLEAADSISGVAFNRHGLMAAGHHDGSVTLWDVKTGQATATLKLHAKGATGLAFSPDGSRLAAGGSDGTTKICEVPSGKELHTLRSHKANVMGVDWSADGRWLATSGSEAVKLWDAASGREVRTWREPKTLVISVAFSPDGQWLASADIDRKVKLWETATGKLVHTLEGHARPVLSVKFSPDGRLLASASGDFTIKLWDARTGALVRTLQGHSDEVGGLAFSPDGQRLASTSKDQTMKVWMAETGQEILTLRGAMHLTRPAFSPDGRLLAAGAFKSIFLWDAGEPDPANAAEKKAP